MFIRVSNVQSEKKKHNKYMHIVFEFQSTPLHLAAGYNRTRIVQLLLQHGADVHAKDKGYVIFTLKPFISSGHK